MVLHGYWRSGTSYRTRIALNIKGLAYRQEPVDLREGEQKSASYLALNPQGLVPALECDDGILTQSSAIIEWLDERYPEPALFPTGGAERAKVRAMAMTVACDIHPLNNLRILKYLRRELEVDQQGVDAWAGTWIAAGFDALEATIGQHGGRFAYGDTLTAVDCHLVPQVYSAERFNVDCTRWPRLMQAVENARGEPPVAAAHPDNQPDAD
ncbi:maleylacetoacetate isomerase [Altererythrobacter salegens]|uniref:Maleylacetoacetate isomerase n=1 Tax=Croceibacterium salegens TaxID=1737568 RepID=A0A6I4SQZ6_9SPHN|nr:maleylacetoacetate isomerase [Croceibacterium salegens]